MEGQNRGAESQPIGDGLNPVGGPVDVAAAAPVAVAVAGGGVTVELGSGGGGGGGQVGKKKRGRPPKAQAKQPPAKKNKEEEEEEDVCFICFDGGSLVLCDRRGCPKAYHPACIKRDEAFFESAAKWNCGWHICSICQKSAHHMCYTCTYSMCKGCIRKADYVCVRGDKGFCTICMKTIMLIENNGQGEDGKVQVDFDDKLSWEYLFKVYWVYLKGKLSLTLDELTQAKNPWKVASTISSVYPSTGVHNRANDLKSITSGTPLGNLEENESKRRKIDEPINILQKETVNTEKLGNENDGSTITVGSEDWATKELLDFISHMKNGDTSVLSQFDVHALMMEYIKNNNLRDPKRKTQIICDSRLKNLFGKSRVGHTEMLKLLDHHLLGKDKKPRNCNKGEEWNNKLDEYAAIDVHNMNLIYLRRNLMENLLEDSESFHGKVVGSIVRIRVSGNDQKHDMYRLVQVVGTSKVDVPYKIGSKLAEFMLEVLNLDKKETISIDTISDQEFSEEECRRLQQSIRCGLVKHFTIGEILEKAVALQPVMLNDWMETEISRLNHLRDQASEKGHKKGYRECMEKLQLLKTPEEHERKLNEIPEVHSDPKMNPDYESDDTEEYFNKEHGEHMDSKYSVIKSKNSRSLKKRPEISNDPNLKSCKNEQPTNPLVEDGSTKATLGLSLGKSEFDFDCDDSTITKWNNNQTTLSSSVSNNAPETAASSLSTKNVNTPSSNDGETNILWHYHDPNGKVQGPFSLVQLQRWSTTGYFPPDMRIWAAREDKSLLLNDVLKEQFPPPTISATPYAPNLEKSLDNLGSSGQSFGQNWSGNNNNLDFKDFKAPSVASFSISNESTGQFNTSNTPRNEADNDIKHVSTVDLPKLIQEDEKKVQSLPNSELLIQDSGNPPSWSSASSLGPANGWDGCSLKPLDALGDHAATPTSNIENNNNNINLSSQPACNNNNNELPSWHGVGEMIEFSTLAEESVSDLLAEVDAMESQYGLPSPTSRRNSFVDDLFNGSFDEFSPTPDQGTRSDGFSSSGDIQLATTTTDEHLVGSFDLMKTSFISPERTNSDNITFKWPRASQCTIDINRSAKAEAEDGEFVRFEVEAPPPLPPLPPPPPPPAPPLTLGLDPFDPSGELGTNTGRSVKHGGDKYNSNNNSSSSRSGRTAGGGGGGYSRVMPLKGQRVCKFYESGRCKKGASCKYLHP